MWDSTRLSAEGNFSLRKIVLIFVAGLMSALFMALAHSSVTFADSATWDGDNIKYQNDTYTKVDNPPTGIPGIAQNNPYIYQFKTSEGKVKIIAVSSTDKTKDITDAQTGIFTVDDKGNYTASGTDPPSNLTISAQSGSGGGGNGGDDSQKTSCGVVSIGWILCGTSRFLAGAMDKVYDWISAFLVIKPLTTDTNSGLFQAWDIARGLANAAFIVAFLVIVYSQITSVGISNYEIKKMIPRLIIAAILVNASYYICTIAVDISNIMGDSVQQALTQLRQALPAPKAQTSWGGITEMVLSGGTIGAIAGLAVMSSGGVLALVPLLVPVLIGGMLSVLVALFVLAARQALITVLVVLAPIAFVAYLLPNTEKQFERWRGLFMNMLMIFPLFSLLFGGSQLASYLIIQNTDQISVVILAMAVQVAPLAITPFLMKVSHNLLTQLGGMMNNPKKGLVDRSRTWANERSQIARNNHNEKGAGKPWYTSSGLSYRRTRGQQYRAKRLSNGQERVAAAIANEERMKNLIAEGKAAELQKSAGEAMGDAQFHRNKAKSAVMQRDSGNLQLAKLQSSAFEHADEAKFQEILSKEVDSNLDAHQYGIYAAEARAAQHALHVAEGNKEAAEKMQRIEWVDELKTNTSLQREVGGIDPNGALTAYAKAKQADVNRKAEMVKQIEDSTSILPGRIYQMDEALRDAINEGNVEKARAYINMLAKSNDPGVHRLRMTLRKFETKMDSNGMLGDIKFHIDNHASLNQDAEDIVKWSREFDRSLKEVGQDAKTWGNQTANKIIGQKMTSQLIAIKSGGVSESTMREILLNPAKVGLKPAVLEEMRRRLKLNTDGSEDEKLKIEEWVNTELARRAAPAAQAMPDPDRDEDYLTSVQIR